VPCVHINGAIVCSRGRGAHHPCGTCGELAGFQCDWKIGGGPAVWQGRTCDAWICATHAQQVGPDKHLCPEHQRTYKEWLAKRVESRITNHESPS